MIRVTQLTDSTSLIGNAAAIRRRYDEDGVLYLRDVVAMARADGTVTVLRKNFY